MPLARELLCGLALLLGSLPALAVQPVAEPVPEGFTARLDRIRELVWQGELERCRSEIEAARAIVADVELPLAPLRLEVLEALLLWREGNLSAAEGLLLGLDLPPQAPLDLRGDSLYALGAISYELGRHRRARDYYEELAALARQAGDGYNEASARYNEAAVYIAGSLARGEGSREGAVTRLRGALELAEKENRDLVPRIHLELGRLLGATAGRGHLERCLALASQPDLRAHCLGALAAARLEDDPDQARRRIEEAVSLARRRVREQGDLWPLVYLWPDRMAVSWETQPRPGAIARCLEILGDIERLRGRQANGVVRAGFFSVWTQAYHWLTGRLLEAPKGRTPGREDLELAFLVGERYRARVLFDSLEAAGAALATAQEREEAGAGAGAAAGGKDGESPSQGPPHQRLAETHSAFPAMPEPRFATLAEVEARLAPDEALLSFQIAPEEDLYGRFAGGSWLLAVRRGGTRVYRLQDGVIEHAVPMYLGLFDRRDGSETRSAATLYGLLLQPALAELPEGIDKLILVPDGELHLLPFGTLRPGPEEPPLAFRYQLSTVPSATLWLRWRRAAASPSPAAALILADPQLVRQPEGRAEPRSQERRALLGDLPQARSEGRAVGKRLGRGSLLKIGEEATEALVKRQDLGRFRILHLAAHAVVNEVYPERSAVHLAAGDGEDGELRIPEIAELGLDGHLVVLSVCESAHGPVLRGEGAVSLARAFFQAGAGTVVASLWPLRDREARVLFEDLYRHLTRGRSVQEALRLAQQARREAGDPAAAWAGVVVLGDGRRAPLAGAEPRLWVWVAAALLAVAVALLLRVGFRRRLRGPRRG